MIDKVDHWFELIKKYGVLAPIDRTKLHTVTSNDCLNYLGIDREYLADTNLVGGSIYVFDFDLEKCNSVFNRWESMERDGVFGKQDDLSNNRLQSHRMDETCMAAALMLNGVFPVTHDLMKYAWQHPETGSITKSCDDPIVIKKHFK